VLIGQGLLLGVRGLLEQVHEVQRVEGGRKEHQLLHLPQRQQQSLVLLRVAQGLQQELVLLLASSNKDRMQLQWIWPRL
jgi:hypothetical protein